MRCGPGVLEWRKCAWVKGVNVEKVHRERGRGGDGLMCTHPLQICTSRETLLGQLSGYIRSVRDDFASRSSSGPAHHQRRLTDPTQAAAAEKQAPPTGKNMPEVVNNIVWTRQLEAKVSKDIRTRAAFPLCIATESDVMENHCN